MFLDIILLTTFDVMMLTVKMVIICLLEFFWENDCLTVFEPQFFLDLLLVHVPNDVGHLERASVFPHVTNKFNFSWHCYSTASSSKNTRVDKRNKVLLAKMHRNYGTKRQIPQIRRWKSVLLSAVWKKCRSTFSGKSRDCFRNMRHL